MESEILTELHDEGIELLNEYEARQVLREYAIPCPTEVFVDADEFDGGVEFQERFEAVDDRPSAPLYLKVVSRDVSSVSDAGGVSRVTDPAAIPETVDRMLEDVQESAQEAEIQGVLAMEDVSGEKRELLLGSTTDPQFGNVVSLGIGGIYVEVYGDVEFRVVPVSESDARSMIGGLDGEEILGEFRGMDPADVETLVDVIVQVSELVAENPEIREMDINPLMANPDGVVAADALIRLS